MYLQDNAATNLNLPERNTSSICTCSYRELTIFRAAFAWYSIASFSISEIAISSFNLDGGCCHSSARS